MSSLLRALLGTSHRHHLALEDIEVPVATAPTTEDTTVVMKGPLADVYSDALLKTLDKDAPVDDGSGAPANPDATVVDTTGLTPAAAPEQNTVEAAVVSEVGSIVLESQAIDAAVAQSLAESVTTEEPAEGTSYETLYAIDQTQVSPEDVKDVTAILADADKPENVTVLIDNVVPEGMIEESQQAEVAAAKELSVAMESMVTALGGKVVHSFKEFVEARRK
jgi:hypothetical protein